MVSKHCMRKKASVKLNLEANLEALEERTLLNGNDFTWVGNGGNWTTPANWQSVQGGTPQFNDNVIFDGTAGKSGPCTVNMKTPKLNVKIENDYESTITIPSGDALNIYNFTDANPGSTHDQFNIKFTGTTAPKWPSRK